MHIFNSWPFALFSANLRRYLPQISWEEHPAVYADWVNYHQEHPLSDLICSRNIDDDVPDILEYPAILTLFHLGDHLVWPVLLAQRGIRFNVILDRNVYLQSKAIFDQLLLQLGAYGHTPELLFSDDRALLLKIRSRKADGEHVLCFVDGASGSNTDKKDERVPVSFLDNIIWLKKGIPFISHLLKMPVVSLLPRDKKTQLVLQIDNIIAPWNGEDRRDYVDRCLLEIYSGLEKTIRKTPYIWECWSYLHQNGMIGKIIDNPFVGDRQALVEIFWNNRKIWFDRINYAACLE